MGNVTELAALCGISCRHLRRLFKQTTKQTLHEYVRDAWVADPAGRRVIELDLMTAAQRAELPENEDITAADRLIVASPTTTGLIVIRALAPETGWVPAARSALASAQCRPQ